MSAEQLLPVVGPLRVSLGVPNRAPSPAVPWCWDRMHTAMLLGINGREKGMLPKDRQCSLSLG